MKILEIAGLLLPLFLGACFLVNAPLTRSGDLYLFLARGHSQALFATAFPPSFPLADRLLWALHHSVGPLGLKLLSMLSYFTCLFFLARFIHRRSRDPLAAIAVVTFFTLLVRETQDSGPVLFAQAAFCFLAPYFFRLRAWTYGEWLAILAGALVWAQLSDTCVLLLVLAGSRAFHLVGKQPARALGELGLLGATVLLSPAHASLFASLPDSIRIGASLQNPDWAPSRVFAAVSSDGGMRGFAFSLSSLTLLVTLAGIFLVAIALVARRRRFPALVTHHGLTSLAFLCLAYSSRHFLFALIWPLAVGALYFPRARWRSFAFRFTSPRLASLCVLLFLSAALLASGLPRTSYVRPLPIHASEFLLQSGLEGKLLVHPSWHGYLTYRVEEAGLGNRIGILPPPPEAPDEFSMPEEILGGLRASAVREKKADLLLYSSQLPLEPKMREEWLTVYENNLSVLLLRRNARFAAGLAKVKAYYRERDLPFDEKEGFGMRAIFLRSPGWVAGNEEHLALGRMPERWIQASRAIIDSTYYASRGLLKPCVDSLADALLRDPLNWRLAVRLEEMLVAGRRLKEAKSWMEALDKFPVPDWAEKNVRDQRWALYLLDREKK